MEGEGERPPGTAYSPNGYSRMAESEPVARDAKLADGARRAAGASP
jgi:hypothetical protein